MAVWAEPARGGVIIGDYFQTLVVQDVDLDEAADFAERVRAIMVEREIARPETSKEHVLDGQGHSPGPKWRRAATQADGARPEGPLTNGVAIDVLTFERCRPGTPITQAAGRRCDSRR